MFGIALVALALGLSNFAAVIGIGLSGVDRHLRIRIAVIFGLFEAVMPVLGLLIGYRVADSLGSTATYFGGGLLVATGVYALVQAKRDTSDENPASAGSGISSLQVLLSVSTIWSHHVLLHRVPNLSEAIIHVDPTGGLADPHAATRHHRTDGG